MKAWSVPSSMFGPGRIQTPMRLTRERDEIRRQIERIEERVKRLPGLRKRLEEVEAELAKFDKFEIKKGAA